MLFNTLLYGKVLIWSKHDLADFEFNLFANILEKPNIDYG